MLQNGMEPKNFPNLTLFSQLQVETPPKISHLPSNDAALAQPTPTSTCRPTTGAFKSWPNRGYSGQLSGGCSPPAWEIDNGGVGSQDVAFEGGERERIWQRRRELCLSTISISTVGELTTLISMLQPATRWTRQRKSRTFFFLVERDEWFNILGEKSGMCLRAGRIIWCSYTHFIICSKLIYSLLIGGQKLRLLNYDRIVHILKRISQGLIALRES